MTVLDQDRAPLDAALADPANTLLLLAGDAASDAAAVHDKAEATIDEPWRRTFLITDLTVLTQAERGRWVNSPGRYAVCKVLGGKVPVKGPVTELLLVSGKPSARKIRSAFAKGDAA